MKPINFDKIKNVKLKGRYAYDLDLHKNASELIVVKAMVAHLIFDRDIEEFIRSYREMYPGKNENDPSYDFCLRTKVPRSSDLVSRKYDTSELLDKIDYETEYNDYDGYSEKGFKILSDKIENFTDKEENRVTRYTISNRISDPRLIKLMPPTEKQIEEGKTDLREISVVKYYHVNICSHMKDFDWSSINYDYYINQTKKIAEFENVDIESL